jgi:hypothetical protein
MQNEKECRMKLFKYNGLLKASLLVSAFLIAPRSMDAQLNTLIDGNDGVLPTPPGLYVTPTAPLTSAMQQPLNPGLANYPNYVAGEAVKAVLSPDGTTLAILTALQLALKPLGRDRYSGFNPVHLPVRRVGRQQDQPCPEAGHPAA